MMIWNTHIYYVQKTGIEGRISGKISSLMLIWSICPMIPAIHFFDKIQTVEYLKLNMWTLDRYEKNTKKIKWKMFFCKGNIPT